MGTRTRHTPPRRGHILRACQTHAHCKTSKMSEEVLSVDCLKDNLKRVILLGMLGPSFKWRLVIIVLAKSCLTILTLLKRLNKKFTSSLKFLSRYPIPATTMPSPIFSLKVSNRNCRSKQCCLTLEKGLIVLGTKPRVYSAAQMHYFCSAVHCS